MHYILILLTLLFFCGGKTPQWEQSFDTDRKLFVKQVLSGEGLILLQKHCYTCHNPKSKSHDEIIAPPLWGMKKHYLEAYPEKTDFEKAMISFIENPTEEKALMKGPIKRFGLMPKPMVDEDDLKKIVEYIYSNELENPAWHIEKDNEKKPKSDHLR
ncbi:hypothetical protein Aoki45_38570 [Algoriphagus sp. oki45]|uniref:c-type cytochrome n=1 Tax=Algoriphagus sp. oki45 TaxID=3067294 RepID=UPI0027F1E42E|nr:hypothetical protein Aoki45_38570 [Algoriphagus sp. oki45]